jgi:hypothetical protein
LATELEHRGCEESLIALFHKPEYMFAATYIAKMRSFSVSLAGHPSSARWAFMNWFAALRILSIFSVPRHMESLGLNGLKEALHDCASCRLMFPLPDRFKT